MERSARLVFVSGRVQGVGFRWFVRERAELHGVTGWVRNRRDGSVETWIEGPAAAIAALLTDLAQGPRLARVDDVDAREVEPTGCAGFEMRPTA